MTGLGVDDYWDTGAPRVKALPKRHINKAAKQHECASCFKPIPAGTSYDRQFVVVDGVPDTVNTHPYCQA